MHMSFIPNQGGKMRHGKAAVALIVTAGFVLAACGGDDGSDDATPTAKDRKSVV